MGNIEDPRDRINKFYIGASQAKMLKQIQRPVRLEPLRNQNEEEKKVENEVERIQTDVIIKKKNNRIARRLKFSKQMDQEINNLECCTICLDEMKAETQAKIDSCDHQFCYKCILEWGKEQENSCPLCRKTFNKITYMGEDKKEKVIEIEDK